MTKNSTKKKVNMSGYLVTQVTQLKQLLTKMLNLGLVKIGHNLLKKVISVITYGRKIKKYLLLLKYTSN